MDELKKLLKIVLYTGYIKGEQPVNLLLVAPPDSGKSALMSRIITNKGIIEVTDITAHGIAKMIAPILERGDEIKHIIIPDFLVVLSKNKSNSERTISFINSLIEEGVTNIASYLNHGIPFRMGEEAKKKRVICGMITGITNEEYNSRKKKLKSFGFISRFVVVRYKYSTSFLNDIYKDIWYGNYLHKEEEQISLPEEPVEVTINETDFIFDQIKILVKNKLMQGGMTSGGVRQVRMFKNMIQAIALKNGRNQVTAEDYNEFLSFEPLINYSGYNVEQIVEN